VKKNPFVLFCNLHPSTSTDDIKNTIEIEEYTVCQVANVIHKITKNKRPIFFIDLEPSETNKEIFNLTLLLHTRVKIEEPHKKKGIVQCFNFQEYRHSRKYCDYPQICVRCEEHHPSTSYVKTRDTYAIYALCKGDYLANYKGNYKQIHQLHISSKNKLPT